LLATSDLHVTHEGNGPIVDGIRPRHDGDWLIVAGDVAESTDAIGRTLAMFTDRFAKVIWAPGNHELWTVRGDSNGLRGAARYDELVVPYTSGILNAPNVTNHVLQDVCPSDVSEHAAEAFDPEPQETRADAEPASTVEQTTSSFVPPPPVLPLLPMPPPGPIPPTSPIPPTDDKTAAGEILSVALSR